MLTITKRLRRFAVKTLKAADDSTDREIRVLYAKALQAKRLTLADLTAIDAGQTPAVKAGAAAKPKPAKRAAPAAPAVDMTALDALVEKRVADALREQGVTARDGDVSPSAAFTKATRIRVKEAAEQYSTSRMAAVYPTTVGKGSTAGRHHPWAGQPAQLDGRTLDRPSERDKAVSLAYMRFMAGKSARQGDLPPWLRMSDHDRELVLYAAHNEKWSGTLRDRAGSEIIIERQTLSEYHIKTLLDDSTSGGIEVSPVVFDDAIILTPVLYGELFPYVQVETLNKGRRVKSASMSNPSFTSGTAEGTAIQTFNTASFISAFDTPVYPAVSAMEFGLDFEEDAGTDVAGKVVEQYGFKALEWLDRVIAVGNGFNEPQGFYNATGATSVSSTHGAGGPFTVSDFEGLMFGVPKQFRGEGGAALAYVANDYTYRKARGIAVGVGDERRVFGMNHMDYTLLETPFKVQNDIPDGYAAFINLRRYRMYRRLGMQVRWEAGGRHNALNNTRLLVVRMRYGGQLELGGAAALMKDGQYN